MTQYAKVPPHDAEIEAAVLGAIMLESRRLKDVMQIIPNEASFYKPAHQEIYKAILHLKENGDGIDQLTVVDALLKADKLKEAGGAYYVAQLTEDVSSAAHIETHARIVFDKFLCRELIRIAMTMQHDAYTEKDAPHSILEAGFRELNQVSVLRHQTQWVSAKIAANAFLQNREEKLAKGVDGLTTTIKKLDMANGGFKGGQFIIIAARPAVGKSAFGLQIILENAKRGTTCGIINLEMSTPETVGRGISQMSGVSHAVIEREATFPHKTLMRHVSEFAKLPIYFSDITKVNIRDIEYQAEKLHQEKGLGLLVVDYLQLVDSVDDRTIREQQIAKISRGLKTLAMRLNIPVIALSQLNRASDARNNKRPSLTDLRESGSLEQDADIVILLHSDWKAGITANEQGNSTEGKADLLVPKWRNGGNYEIELNFDGPTMRFSQADLIESHTAGIANRPFTPPTFEKPPF